LYYLNLTNLQTKDAIMPKLLISNAKIYVFTFSKKINFILI